MGVPYAEVIGDPIAHSKSPLIHTFWLEKLGIKAEYRATRVSPNEMPRFIKERCSDRNWRGCNVTAPLKQVAARMIGDPVGLCARLGAANLILRSPLGCGIAANTDVEGVAAALKGARMEGAIVCVIGAGGAARAALCYLRAKPVAELRLVVRDRARGEVLAKDFPAIRRIDSFDEAGAALEGVGILINATPLGMSGGAPMHEGVLTATARLAAGATVFDMVYAPLETALLRRARELGHHAVDGLEMLIGQAAPAFELFFGERAPRAHDEALRRILMS